jgi:hypothetical protein
VPVPGGDEEGYADEDEIHYEDEVDEAREFAVRDEGLEGEVEQELLSHCRVGAVASDGH